MKKILLLSFFLNFCLFAPPNGSNAADNTTALIKLQQVPEIDTDPETDIFDSGPYQCPTVIDQISWAKFVKMIRELNIIIVDGLGPMGIADKGLKNIEG